MPMKPGEVTPPPPEGMSRKNLKMIRREEAGFALVEILVSAIMLVITAVGVFTAFEVGNRATAEERHRAQANALAEADLARMQSLRIADLATLNQSRTVTQDGTPYTITSVVTLQIETASTSTCASGTGSRDYLRATSTVTWPSIGSRPPITASGVVSPPSGSIIPNAGALLVSLTDSRAAPLQNAALTGSGAGSFSGTTGSAGCVLWRNLPAGNYSLSVGGSAASMVDVNGKPPAPQTVSVVDQSTNTVQLQYDLPGTINNIRFTAPAYTTNLPTAFNVDSAIIFNSGMQTSKQVGTPGSPVPSLSAGSLFPFTSPYSVYAGLCDQNNPGAGNALANLTVPVGGSILPSVPILMPALHLTVWSGNSSSSPGSVVSNASVRVWDTACPNIPSANFARNYTTNASGQLPNPALPYSFPGPGTPPTPPGGYKVCAQATIGGTQRRNYVNVSSTPEYVPLTNLLAGTVRNIYLGTSASGVLTGLGATCPVSPP
jgi:Tfp pilus assembly protein PilX